jgi:hypothetical protein
VVVKKISIQFWNDNQIIGSVGIEFNLKKWNSPSLKKKVWSVGVPGGNQSWYYYNLYIFWINFSIVKINPNGLYLKSRDIGPGG